MSSEFLEQLDKEAAERLTAAQPQSGDSCGICKGSGSVTRYVLPHVTGPVKCISCKGTGKAL